MDVEGISSDHLGLNDLNDDNDPRINITSDGFVPSLHSNETELAEMQNGLQFTEAILTMPTIDSVPINEHDSNLCYMIDAFPCLYPEGKADFHIKRPHTVSAQEYFKHLIRYRDGRFARHPRFRYFTWNSILRWDGKKRSRIFAKRYPNDGVMTVGKNIFIYSNSYMI